MSELSITQKAVIQCEHCNDRVFISAHKSDVAYYLENRSKLPLIQDHFPQLSDDERELILSKTCGKCFDQMFEVDGDDVANDFEYDETAF